MPVWEILALAVGLGMDAMSVCMAIGVKWHGPRQQFRMAWHMGLFQFLMPLLGWSAGKELAGLLKSVGTYLAAGLVFAVGVKMLLEAIRSRPGAVARKVESAAHRARGAPADPTRGWSLAVLSVATSLDALVVGFSLGLKEGAGAIILPASLVIGVVAAAMALIGIALGKRVGMVLGRPAEVLGALVLMALAVAFLWPSFKG